MENLDLKCAELGRCFAEQKDVTESLLTDGLSVLEEQGLYAYFLFLKAGRKQPGEAVSKMCAKFLQQTPVGSPLLAGNDPNEPWKSLQMLAENLDNLLFARDLLRQALVYGRYHAKACGGAGAGA